MKNPNSHLKFSSAIIMLLVMGTTSLRFALLPPDDHNFSEKGIAAALLQDIKVKKSLSWRLIATHDPYQGKKFLRTNPNNTTQLRLNEDGTFKEIKKDRIENGRWKLRSDSYELKMLCQRINGRMVKRSQAFTAYTLISYDADFLVLGKQGRHGIVELKFKSLKPTQRSEAPEFI